MMWTRLMGRRGGAAQSALRLVFVAVLGVVVVFPAGAFAGQLGGSDGAVPVVFEGEPIDLAAGWGDAKACLIWSEAGVAECFRTEAEMDARITELEQRLWTLGGVEVSGSRCSGSMRLYDGWFYTGQVLYMRDRLQWINLSAYGFSNRTSSFKIGPCSAYLADHDWGGGSWYSTSATEAWDVAAVMASGWSNRVSSVYIR